MLRRLTSREWHLVTKAAKAIAITQHMTYSEALYFVRMTLEMKEVKDNPSKGVKSGETND